MRRETTSIPASDLLQKSYSIDFSSPPRKRLIHFGRIKEREKVTKFCNNTPGDRGDCQSVPIVLISNDFICDDAKVEKLKGDDRLFLHR